MHRRGHGVGNAWRPTAARMLLTLATATVSAWALGLAVVARSQAQWIFGSPRARRSAPSGPHACQSTRSVSLVVAEGVRLEGWLTTPPTPATRLAIWFGGRNEDVGWIPAIGSWLGPDWAVCSFNYRGRVGSTGEPGEAACVDDALRIVAWACAEVGVPVERVALFGRSLGSGIAIQAAAQLPVAALLLLAPPASLRRLAMRHPVLLPALPWLAHPFDSMAVAHRVRCPSLILLAQRDRRVPHSESQRLARALRRPAAGQASNPCEVVTIGGTDHRSLARHARTLDAMARYANRVSQGSNAAGSAREPADRQAGGRVGDGQDRSRGGDVDNRHWPEIPDR